jgi:pseudouridine-5'-phosphate glycosidase
MHKFLHIHPKVQEALDSQKPIVALESTIISHGMPYPKNVETALQVEEIIEQQGCVAATIAIMNGKCCVGLSQEQIETLAKEKNVTKVSLRDMPFVLTQNQFGATTVAATMRIASMVGIKVFVTGGIGGVHRGAEKSMDISADLTELQQTNVAVVSAGIKSILDIGLTLEYLETLGVPVVTFGSKNLPGFYSNNSGFQSPLSLNNVQEIAALIFAKWQLQLQGGVLVANPVPTEFEVPNAIIEQHILQALQAAEINKTKGKEITPFLLQHIAQHTQGESLTANIALIKNNALLGAKLSIALNSLYANNQ